MSDPSAIVSAIQSLPAEYAQIDILVNNAGLVKGVAKSPEIDIKDIKTMFDTNVTGLITMTQEVMKIMLKRGESGQGDIINIGSIAGREGYQGGSIYCATKAAVRTFTDALRRELVASRIRVIEIDPGQVETVRSPNVVTCSEQSCKLRGWTSELAKRRVAAQSQGISSVLMLRLLVLRSEKPWYHKVFLRSLTNPLRGRSSP